MDRAGLEISRRRATLDGERYDISLFRCPSLEADELATEWTNRLFLTLLWSIVGVGVPLSSFYCYTVVFGHELTVAIAFTVRSKPRSGNQKLMLENRLSRYSLCSPSSRHLVETLTDEPSLQDSSAAHRNSRIRYSPFAHSRQRQSAFRVLGGGGGRTAHSLPSSISPYLVRRRRNRIRQSKFLLDIDYSNLDDSELDARRSVDSLPEKRVVGDIRSHSKWEIKSFVSRSFLEVSHR